MGIWRKPSQLQMALITYALTETEGREEEPPFTMPAPE